MKSFKVKFDAKKLTKEFKQRFEKFREEEEWKKEASEIAIKNIIASVRLGKYIGDKSKLPSLKKSTIESRKKFAEKNETGTSFNASKSNATLSGQLLESLERQKSKKDVLIRATKPRKPYKGQAKTPTNEELMGYLAEKGINILGYDGKVQKLILTKLLRHIRRSLLRR